MIPCELDLSFLWQKIDTRPQPEFHPANCYHPPRPVAEAWVPPLSQFQSQLNFCFGFFFFWFLFSNLFYFHSIIDHLICINQPTDSSVSNYSACSFTIRLFNFSSQLFNLMWIHIKTVHKHSTSWLCEFILWIN